MVGRDGGKGGIKEAVATMPQWNRGKGRPNDHHACGKGVLGGPPLHAVRMTYADKNRQPLRRFMCWFGANI